MGSTVVLQRRFDPEATLAAIEAHRVRVCAMVPVMLQRIMALPEEVRARHDTSSLEVVALSGSALSGDLAAAAMDAFGDVLFNLYGSTEVAWATIATPRDLRRAPGTAGRPPRGTELRIVDDAGKELPLGRTGRVVVRNEMLFEGYTGGETRATVDGFMATGDVGHLDHAGRLFLEGRDDDMVVSGGENVFPQEVEQVLQRHPAVADAACAGVDDDDFGQRLAAWVVLREGASATEDELREHVRGQLARFKVPRDVHLVDELPRTSTGKVVRRALA
jgi:fatty-acyl-CoA synthase